MRELNPGTRWYVLEELAVIFSEEAVDGRARVTTAGGW